ncbi:protein DBF4 homolog B-like [Haliotis asinina]|uniref:protein DBF4 homolog B-like n=1 Tax=Haliotis asinina TaxID=109174 RepID=UPI003531E2CD
MCDSMEDSPEACARRRLEFRSMPFKSKSFYVDVKSKPVRQRVEGYIRQLGGSVETFLSNDVHVCVSDSRPLTKRPSRLRGETTLDRDDVSKRKQDIPLSRGRALLLKARKNTSESLASEVNNASNIQDKAAEMGINTEHVHTFIKRCKELGASSKQVTKKDPPTEFLPIKWEDKCFIKVEDDSCQYKPIHKKLENIPLLYPDNGGGSPFDGPVVLARPTTGSTVKKGTKPSRFSHNKGGYCEMCQCWYKDSLRTHSRSVGHQKFVRNKENFAVLDQIVRKLPNLYKFLFKYIPVRNVDKPPCYKSDITPVTSPEIPTTQPTNKDVYDFDDPSENVANVEDVSNVQPLEGLTILPASNTTTNFTSNTPPLPLIDTILSGEINTPEVPDKVENSVTPALTLNDSDVFSCILGDNVADAKMFSDISEADSQTNVLKNLIDNLSLQNVNSASQITHESPMIVNTPHIPSSQPVPSCTSPTHPCDAIELQPNPSLTSCTNSGRELDGTIVAQHGQSVTLCTGTESSPDTSSENSTSQTMTSCISTSRASDSPIESTPVVQPNDETPMSVGSPVQLPRVTASIRTPGQLKLKLLLNGAANSSSQQNTNRSNPRCEKDKTKVTYYSHKTSDTKLKLCKVVVTPVAQKSNLKMFWKVRKTGDCRLLFSSEKRKRSVPDENATGVGDEMMSPLRAHDVSPKPKRQRLVF